MAKKTKEIKKTKAVAKKTTSSKKPALKTTSKKTVPKKTPGKKGQRSHRLHGWPRSSTSIAIEGFGKSPNTSRSRLPVSRPPFTVLVKCTKRNTWEGLICTDWARFRSPCPNRGSLANPFEHFVGFIHRQVEVSAHPVEGINGGAFLPR